MSIVGKLYYKLPMPVKRTCSHLRLFKLYRPYPRYQVAEVDGVYYSVDLRTYVGSSLGKVGVYEKDTSQIIERYVHEGDTAIDIGASIGAHAMRMAKRVGSTGKVYAFEPSKFLIEDLQKNIKLNFFKNVVPENIALSNVNGVKSMRMEKLGFLDGSKLEQPYSRAKCSRLDDYIKEKNIERLDFVKIDTDGAEVEIIEGFIENLKRFKPLIVIEIRESTVRKLFELLTGIGYSFYSPDFKLISEKDLIKQSKKVNNVVCKV